MLTEEQQDWLLQAKPEAIGDMFNKMRIERLQTLNRATPNYEEGRFIQDEIGALHRLEKWLLDKRSSAVQQDKKS
jgi:hypothetical protein